MLASSDWRPVEPDLETILGNFSDPLRELSQAEIPAIIFRQIYNPAQFPDLINRLTNMGLMRPYSSNEELPSQSNENQQDRRTRIDIGTSLGNLGNNKELFFQHAATTHFLFKFLFEGLSNPIDIIYEALSDLAVDKQVEVAREPNGQLYGPAIFRIHYTSHAYKPHIDHVTLRENRTNYAVHRFKHQFAGILCVQNADGTGNSTQAILHHCLWTPKIQPHITNDTFHDYATKNQIERCQIDLEPGDLYFFNTRCIHEVPAVEGNVPRIVLAVFIGYSEDDDKIYVWS